MTNAPQLFTAGIDNADILTPNVDLLVEFYHGLLGLPFFLPYEPGQGWAAVDTGNVVIYIFDTQVGTHEKRRTPINPENAPGFDSMALSVSDLDEVVAYLDGKVEWASDAIIPWHHPSGVWYRFRPFCDPDGNMIYATEPHTENSLR